MNWFQKHIEAITIIGAIAAGVWIVSGKISESNIAVCKEICEVRIDLSKEIAKTNAEMSNIKTILIVKDLVKKEEFFSPHNTNLGDPCQF